MSVSISSESVCPDLQHITSPMSAEQYTVVADFLPDGANQVKLYEGDTVSVNIKKDTGRCIYIYRKKLYYDLEKAI